MLGKGPQNAILDEHWRRLIRVMFGFRCAMCGKEGHDCHHHVGRADKRHRWHPLNGILLCVKCHAWAHEHPRKFKAWLKENLRPIYDNSFTKGLDGMDRFQISKLLRDEYKNVMATARSNGHSSFHFMPLVLAWGILLWILAWLLLPRANP